MVNQTELCKHSFTMPQIQTRSRNAATSNIHRKRASGQLVPIKLYIHLIQRGCYSFFIVATVLQQCLRISSEICAQVCQMLYKQNKVVSAEVNRKMLQESLDQATDVLKSAKQQLFITSFFVSKCKFTWGKLTNKNTSVRFSMMQKI